MWRHWVTQTVYQKPVKWTTDKWTNYSTIACSNVYPYTCGKRKSYQAPATRGFQSICETNATTIYLSRGRKRTLSFQREVGLQPSVALETFLEEVKLELASVEFDKPKDNISTGERQALKELSRNKSIILKKSDKGNTTVLMSRQDKLNEGQVLLDDLNNYRPIDKPMVETTTKKVQQLIKTLLSEGTLIKRQLNGSPLRLFLRESQCFTHLLKSTNRHLSADLLSQGVPGLQNGSQHLLTTLFSQ